MRHLIIALLIAAGATARAPEDMEGFAAAQASQVAGRFAQFESLFVSERDGEVYLTLPHLGAMRPGALAQALDAKGNSAGVLEITAIEDAYARARYLARPAGMQTPRVVRGAALPARILWIGAGASPAASSLATMIEEAARDRNSLSLAPADFAAQLLARNPGATPLTLPGPSLTGAAHSVGAAYVMLVSVDDHEPPGSVSVALLTAGGETLFTSRAALPAPLLQPSPRTAEPLDSGKDFFTK